MNSYFSGYKNGLKSWVNLIHCELYRKKQNFISSFDKLLRIVFQNNDVVPKLNWIKLILFTIIT